MCKLFSSLSTSNSLVFCRSSTSFKAIIKNGELVQSEEGYLKVTNSVVAKSRNVYSDSSHYSDHINTNIHGVPLNLSMRDQVSQGQNGISMDSFNPFPALSNNSSNNDVVAKRPTKQEAGPPPTELDVQVKKPLPKDPMKSTGEEATSKSNKSFEASVSVKPTPMSPSNVQNDLKILFPYLKMTNTGSLVLWNFLWALLKDENYNKIIRFGV